MVLVLSRRFGCKVPVVVSRTPDQGSGPQFTRMLGRLLVQERPFPPLSHASSLIRRCPLFLLYRASDPQGPWVSGRRSRTGVSHRPLLGLSLVLSVPRTGALV